MRYLNPLFLFFVSGLIICACNKIVCQKDGTIRYFTISDYDTSVKTSFRVVRYDIGSNFTIALDSTERVLENPFNLSLPVEESKEYKIVLLPQKRQHRIANIHLGNEKRKGSPGRDSEQCHVSITFTYDGETIEQPYWVNAGGGGYVNLKL